MKRKLSLFITLIFIFSILLSDLYINADTIRTVNQNSKSYKDGELLVKYKDDVQAGDMSTFAAGKGLKIKNALKDGAIKVYGVKNGMSVDSAIKSLMKSELVEYAQPNYIYRPMSAPDDNLYDELWGINNTGQAIDGQAGVVDVDVNAPEAWDITEGREDIIVAVIDEGVYIDHPDLKNNIWINMSEIPDNGIDDDDNGYIDDINGWDFYNKDNTVFDELDGDAHGTHVAGTIAASADSVGVVGIAPSVKIMPLKFFGAEGGYTSDAIAAIEYASNNGAHIVNCSWGASPGQSVDLLLKETIEASELLFVMAAGNEYNNNDIKPVYPASYDCENIIAVAAVDNKGNKPGFSNYGALSVDVGAPGLNILSTVPVGLGGTAAIIVTDAVYTYQAFYSSIDINDFLLEEDKLDFIAKVVSDSVISLNADDNILVVDDDENDETEDAAEAYLNILESLDFVNINEVEVSQNYDGPSFEEMSVYDAVIWITGEAYGSIEQGITTLTDNDQSSIVQYLQDNKKLILIGQDALFGITGSSLFSDYLKIDDCIEYGLNDEIKWSDELFEDNYYDVKYNDYRDIILHSDDYVKPVMEYVQEWGIYDYNNGTSMAAPHVSGISALLMSKNPGLTPSKIKAAIMDTIKPLDSLSGKTVAGGMADAYEALKATPPMTPSDIQAVKSNSDVTLTWSGAQSGDFVEYIVERKAGSESYLELSRTPDTSYIDSGIDIYSAYSYRVNAVDNWGNKSDLSDEIAVAASAIDSEDSIDPENPINTEDPGEPGDNDGTDDSSSSSSSGGSGGGGGGPVSTAPVETKPSDSVDSEISKQLGSTSNTVDIQASSRNGVDSASISFDYLSKLFKLGKKLIIRGADTIFEISPGAFETEELKDYLSSSKSYLNIKSQKLKEEESKELSIDSNENLISIDDNIFEFTATARDGSKKKDIESFNNKIKIGIKIDGKQADKYGKNKIGGYSYDENVQKWEYLGGSYDTLNGTISFMTDHFSKFALMMYSKNFDDMKGHWAEDDVNTLTSRHIAEGRNNSFEPDKYINRAELVSMLVKALMQMPDRDVKLTDDGSMPFKDVSITGDDRLYISASTREGLVKGFDDGTFRPQNPVSREELAVLISRMMNLNTEFDILETPFKDKEYISAWAAKEVAAAFEKGIITGDIEGNFRGKRSVTRAEAAVMVRRMMESMGLMDMPIVIEGKLVINYIEGTHYELETEDGIYVLISAENDEAINRMLRLKVGMEIKVKGYVQDGFNIYQRGKLFKVIYIE